MPRLHRRAPDSRLLGRKRVLVELAVFDDAQEVALVILEDIDVLGRLAVYKQHVRPSSLLKHAELRLFIGIPFSARCKQLAVPWGADFERLNIDEDLAKSGHHRILNLSASWLKEQSPYVIRIGKELQTDAWHYRSDAITSALAFVGISIALIGGRGWESADEDD